MARFLGAAVALLILFPSLSNAQFVSPLVGSGTLTKITDTTYEFSYDFGVWMKPWQWANLPPPMFSYPGDPGTPYLAPDFGSSSVSGDFGVPEPLWGGGQSGSYYSWGAGGAFRFSETPRHPWSVYAYVPVMAVYTGTVMEYWGADVSGSGNIFGEVPEW